MKVSIIKVKTFFLVVKELVFSPAFIAITVFGNIAVAIFAFSFFLFELGANDQVRGLFDAIWWSFATITTVGYGDITPVTIGGRVIGIITMLAGTAIFATYTALFAQALLSNFRKSVKKIESKENILISKLERIEKQIKSLSQRS